MSDKLFHYTRLTPSVMSQIATAINSDRRQAERFVRVVLDRGAALIPRHGRVGMNALEQVFLMAIETRRIFLAAHLDMWEFFEKPAARTLLGHVFISAVEGMPLRDIIKGAEPSIVVTGDGELEFDTDQFVNMQIQRRAAVA